MPKRWDLIVVGGGTAGLPAAIFSARRGASVLVLEHASEPGGSLLMAMGQMSAAGTKLQARKGIEDTPQVHFDDIMRISKGTADEPIVRLATENAAETLDWLEELGFEPLPEHPVLGQVHEPYSRERYCWGSELGRSIATVLIAEVERVRQQNDLELKLDTEVKGLIQNDDGSIAAVQTVNKQGDEQSYSANQVLLSCGGYSSNPEMFQDLNGAPQYGDVAYPYSQGMGIRLACSVGGYTRGKENYLCSFGVVLEDDNFPSKASGRVVSVPQNRPPWEIYVNTHGRRFVREDEPSIDVREHALLVQPEQRFWTIFDEAIFRQAPPVIQDWSVEQIETGFDTHPMFYRASSLEALAAEIGIDPGSLTETVAQYNAGQQADEDEFGREHMPLPIAQAPFYAVRVQGVSVSSTVGVTVDENLRVMTEAGVSIANLYAAGELLGSGQTMGSAFCGGMMITPALTFGRLLGDRIIPLEARAGAARESA